MLTNTNIANLYLKDAPVDKLMLGHAQVWPTEPMLAFDLYPSGDKIEFEVVSDTQFIACTVDDSDIYLFEPETTDSPKTQIKVDRPGANSQTINIESSYVIPVQIPLFIKDIITVSGIGSNRSRYVSDHNSGKIKVNLSSRVSEITEVFSVSITGKGTQTKTVDTNSNKLFEFTGLSSGTKTITVRSDTTGVEFTTQVYINLNRTALQPQSKTLRARGIGSDSGELMRIKIYSLTEEEAIRNYQEAYGTEASINIETRQLYSMTSQAHQYYDYDPTYYVTEFFFKIVNGGWGYPPNARLPLRVRDLMTYSGFWKLVSLEPRDFVWCFLVTNGSGRIVDIQESGYREPKGEEFENLLVFEEMHHYGLDYSSGTGAFNHKFSNVDANRYQPSGITPQSTTQSRNVPWDYWYSTLVHTGWFTSWTHYAGNYLNPPGRTLETSIMNLISDGKIDVTGTNKKVNITYGNLGVNTGITGTWFKNLIFDNFDDLGHIRALHLGNIDIERVIVTSQQQLHVVQSDKFGGGTTTGAVGNGKIQIKNSAEYEYTHGLGITYTYQ